MRPDILATMANQHGLITRRQAVEIGLAPETIDLLVRTGAWTRAHRGVYAETTVVANAVTTRDRRLLADRAASLRIGPAHVMSHDSSAYELGMMILHASRPFTHVTRPRVVGSHLRHGVKHHLAPFQPRQVIEVNGRRVLDPARTAADIAREHGNPAGVVAMDSALQLGATDDDLAEVVASMRSWPGVTVVREARELSDPDSDSPGEGLCRLLVTELGFGRPQTQFGLTDGQRTAWCDLRLGRHLFEFDGRAKYQRVDEGGYAVESVDEVLWREKQRQDWLCGFKLGMTRITWADLFGARRGLTLERCRREYLDTCARLGTSIDDLTPFLARGPRPRPHCAAA